MKNNRFGPYTVCRASRGSSLPNLVRISPTVLKLFKFLYISKLRRRHLGFRYFQIFGLFSHLVSPVLRWNEFWCMWLERFRSCGVLSIFQFPYTLTWDFTAHAHKQEVDFRFSLPTNSSVSPGSWWSVPNLVKIGEELQTL